MKKAILTFCLIGCYTAISWSQVKVSEAIRINQLGYYPESNKIFVVANSPAVSFDITNEVGNVIYSAKLSAEKHWDASGENLKTGDFSILVKAGKYRIVLNDRSTSYPFEIKPSLYSKANIEVLKAFYYQRMSIPIEEKYAGIYHRAMGHPDTACYFHPSSGYTVGQKPSPGGWYDAGDYNKYVVNAGITLGLLLKTNELYPNWIPDGTLNIPESGNGKNDLLDEIRFELNWLLTMQDTDGGVFFKLTNLKFDPVAMPDKTIEKRYFVGKSTTSALCFAAATAQASRVYFSSDKDFSKILLEASERAWQWAIKNPAIEFKNPQDVLTGEYGDKDFQEEFFWAAAELSSTTGKLTYYDAVNKYKMAFQFSQGDNWRNFLSELAYFTLIESKNFPDKEKEGLKTEIVKVADSLVQKLKSVPYRIPMERFTWGSNSDIADGAIIFAYANRIKKDPAYLNAALETVDYIFGKNATTYSFVTGLGSKPVMNVHHRLSGADGIVNPIPGFLAGGPNSDRPDEGTQPWQVKYPNTEPARCYLDNANSYASNEVAINWNAPLFFILSIFENEVK